MTPLTWQLAATLLSTWTREASDARGSGTAGWWGCGDEVHNGKDHDMTPLITDDAHIFTPADLSAIEAAGSRWPFELSVVTSTDAPSKSDFEHTVSARVTGPNVVSVGVDPTHHSTIVRVGKETGIPPSTFASIAAAGDSAFRGARWRDGILEIADHAAASKVQAVAHEVQVAHEEQSTHYIGWGVLWIAGLAALVAGFVVWRRRRADAEARRKLDELKAEVAENAQRNIEEADWHERFRSRVASMPAASSVSPVPFQPRVIQQPPVAYPAYSPPIVVNTGNESAARLEGMIEGGALGYMVGNSRVTEEPARARRRPIDDDPPAPAPAPPAESSDSSGGSSSSWGSTDSSYDSGGSSSSWDSGGSSSDFGGGDSGGGGGDSSW